MKAKRILNTLVIILSIVFLMNGVSMALEQKQIGIINPVFSCSMSVALAGFCIESTNPNLYDNNKPDFPRGGGDGTITVYFPNPITISATSDSYMVTITGYRVLDANHLLFSYHVDVTDGVNSCDNGHGYKTVGTITVWGNNLYKKVVITRGCIF